MDPQQTDTPTSNEAQASLPRPNGSDSFDIPREEDDLYYEDDTCERCQGEGTIMVCIDDICHGQGFCMHGDGDITCPSCRGTGIRRGPNTQAHGLRPDETKDSQ